jgi:signal transduction histidine kinase
VEIAVEDNGAGIPREMMDKIFDPFFTTKEPGKGTGLGLSVSQRIVQIFDGSISVESEPGKGTTFRVTLPAAEGDGHG